MKRRIPIAALIAGLGFLLGAPAVTAADHPTLIEIKTEMCKVCHEDLLENKAFSHSPVVDDCTVCHEVTQGDEGTSIGLSEPEPQVCFMCHDDLEDAANGDVASPHAPVMGSCLFCHEVHGGDHPALLTNEPAVVCAECHEKADIAASHSDQLPDNADCMNCHLPHGGPTEHMFSGTNAHAPFSDGSCDGCHRKPFGARIRLRNRGEKLCTACHGDFDTPAGGVAHQALNGEKGKAGCLSCHDPHMSDQAHMLTSDGAALCTGCHQPIADLTGMDNAHPAAEDCGTCHLPHVSEEPGLLAADSLELCGTCHDTADDDLSAKHLGADLASLDCNACHDPHGSEHGKLLARNLHPPVLDGCDVCHEGGFDELADDGESSLCLMCHDEGQSAEVPHAALEVARCVDCHNAHASPNERLVLGRGGQVCLECHDSQSPIEGETAHGAIERFGCQACHLPHGGNQATLLRVSGDELCLGCHDANLVDRSARDSGTTLLDRFAVGPAELRNLANLTLSRDNTVGHPTPGHLVRGTPTQDQRRIKTDYEGELGCLTCHDPHKGTGGLLFRWNAANRSDLCTHCHTM